MGSLYIDHVIQGFVPIDCKSSYHALTEKFIVQGTIGLALLSALLPTSLLDTHRRHRLETEVSLDTGRAWCPAPDCQTICHVCPGPGAACLPVTCPTCVTQFCASCRSAWHPGLSCEEAGEKLVSSEYIKLCPVRGTFAGRRQNNVKLCLRCAVFR